MHQLDSISIKGFKSIASIEDLKLGALNVLIGPNGSGKSNFIGVFSFLREIREGRLQEYVAKAGGAGAILHFGAVTPRMQIQVSFHDAEKSAQYSIDLVPTVGNQLFPIEKADTETLDGRSFSSRAILPLGWEAGISGKTLEESAGTVQGYLDKWCLYHFHDTSASSPLKTTADLNNNRYLRSDGSNLVSFLYYLRSKHENAYKLIRGAVQRVAPFFDDFVLEPMKLNPDKIRLEWRHKGSDAYFDVSSLSDGTLRFIALATLFLQPENHRPSLIIVDEPELGLHPFAITLLASFAKQASAQTQVIIATQSPILLDHFQPEDVLVAERKNGGTQLTRLDSEKLKNWLEDYSLGQLWEKNELGGRPAPE